MNKLKQISAATDKQLKTLYHGQLVVNYDKLVTLKPW